MKKKLLFIIDTIRPQIDGVSTFLDKILSHLAEKYDVTVIAPNYGNQTYPNIKLIKVPVILVDESGYGVIRISRKIIKEEVKKCDIIFTNESVSPLMTNSIFALRYSRKYKKPYFIYIHSIDWELFPEVMYIPRIVRIIGKKLLMIYGRWFLGNKMVIIVSFPTIAEILKGNNLFGKYEFAPIGISQIFKPGPSKYSIKDNVVIGYCGRISREKGLMVLLNAYQNLRKKHENIHLLIVGDGPSKQLFENQKNITVTGFVNSDEVAEYYRAMDVFVLASFTEANSLSTLEALRSGVCSVTRDVGAIHDYLKNDYNGYLFKSDEEVEKILEKLITNKDLREKLKRNASKSVQEYTWANTAKHLSEIFEKYS